LDFAPETPMNLEQLLPLESQVLLARWKDGTFTFLFAQDQQSLPDALDVIGDPAGAEVRVVPFELLQEVTFNQPEKGAAHFEINVGVEREIWRKCVRQVWPLEALGS
jgi:hypothetical protein